MATRLPLQLNLNLLCDVIEEFAETIDVSLTDNNVVFIFGDGEAQDNWEAFNQFISALDGRTVATREALLARLHGHLRTALHFMRMAKLKQGTPTDNADHPFGILSPAECKTLAAAMVFLAEYEIRRNKIRLIGQSGGAAMLTHLATWDREAVQTYCVDTLQRHERRYYKQPAELLPLLVNRFYHKAVVRWITRGAIEQ